MDLQLEGKTAVVTGGTRGIGRAIAETFADEGANVAICARKADQVAERVEALQAKGVKAWGEVVDIADGAALQTFVKAVADKLGGLDVLVSNASALVQGNAGRESASREACWDSQYRACAGLGTDPYSTLSIRTGRAGWNERSGTMGSHDGSGGRASTGGRPLSHGDIEYVCYVAIDVQL